jgi:tRNA (cmo5U34)-methyltransferase
MNAFSDPEAVARYAEGPPRLVPGFAGLHRMTSLLLAERVPAGGRVLVLGAGGGLELEHLADAHPGWRFDGVDPSAEMLGLAEATVGRFGPRIRLHEGYVDAAPDGPFDGATCLLTLHFLPADERRRTLEALRARLAPGAPLVVAHHSYPREEPQRTLWLERFAAFSGATGAEAARMVSGLRERLPALSPEEDERLLREAGFSDVGLFYAGLTFRGWVAYA